LLFNSYAFIFVFFPIVWLGFFAIGRRNARAAAGFLGLASLFFYGWWSLQALPLLLGSICFNYWAGMQVSPREGVTDQQRKRRLVLALTVNLTVLAIFKYANFFIDNINEALVTGGISPLHVLDIALPIGISFYTFTQIAFIVDCWQGKVLERRFVHYLLFVTYFPHLIAGPVLHHAQMMPQFASPATYRPDANKIALGLAIFTFGLAKKLLLGDPLGQGADLVFHGAANGVAPTLYTAWLGVLGYTLQLYFDFSGYSDMAIGISLCLGVRLPLNFASPYKSTSIIEFWRRWHITLSNFLRDYLYIPLGGNRKGPARRYVNLFITMLLGGLWHGAGWTFVLWGAMHGALLIVNHLWNAVVPAGQSPGRVRRLLGWALTFFCVMLAWVVFRAHDMHSAVEIYKGLFGFNGINPKSFGEFANLNFHKPDFFQPLLVGLIVAFFLPPTIALERWVPGIQVLAARPRLARAASAGFAVLTVYLLAVCVSSLGVFSPFLYFQF